MKRVLLDQGLPASAAAILRAAGWDAIHVRELGMQEAADLDILAYAAQQSRTVITLDRDFPQILAMTAATHPSVILIRQQGLRAAGLVELAAAIWHHHEHEIDQGCVVTAGARGARIRMLPLK